MKNIILVIAMLSAPTLLADVWYSNRNKGFGDKPAYGNTALTDMSYWTKGDTEGSGKPTLADDLIFNGTDQSKPLRIRMLGSGEKLNFTGNSFQLGTDDTSVTMVYDGGTLNFKEEAEGLKLKNGNFWVNQYQNSESYPIRISGKAHVLGNSEGKPFVFNVTSSYAGKMAQLDFSLFGEQSAWLLFGPYPKTIGELAPACASNTTFMVRDISGYAGLITVTSAHKNVEANFGTCLKLGSATSSATIDVGRGGSLSAYDFATELTVKNLSMAAGTRLWFNQSKKAERLWRIKATDSANVTGKVQIYMDTMIVGFGKKSMPILEGPASSFTEDDFELVYPESMAPLMKASNVSLKVKEENGRCVLLIEAFGFIDQLSSKPSEGDKSENGNNQSSFTNELAWRDGLLPGSDTVAAPDVPNGSRLYYTDMALRTTFEVREDYVFPADYLFLDDSAKLIIQKKSFQVPILHCGNGNVEIGIGQNHPGASTFPVRLVADHMQLSHDRDSVVKLRSYSYAKLMIDAEIKGSASLNLEGWSNTGSPRAEYGLTGLNTNFTGSILVSQIERREAYVSFTNFYPTLHVYDGRNLGGRMESFDPRALTLMDMARLSVTNGTKVALAKNLNRGVYILGKGRFYTTKNSVLDVQWPILLSGTMWKEGPGTLILGGAMKHEAADGGEITDIPRAGSNAFEIVEGVAEIAHADAVAGAEMRIAAKASLMLSVDQENAELLEYGIRNTSTATPFALDESFGGKLPLSIDWSNVSKSDAPITVGLVTVKKELKDAALAMMPSLRPPWTAISCELVTIDRENGSVTIALKVRPHYMRIIIR
jgi:hypothetical protein